jgi:acyl carrier protein
MKTTKAIKRFIEDELLDELSDGADPLASRQLDSLAVEELVAHLEESYDIEFDDSELVAENFASVDVLAALVDMKRKGTHGSRIRADTA